jgi:ketosteroid isomerase-like protein
MIRTLQAIAAAAVTTTLGVAVWRRRRHDPSKIVRAYCDAWARGDDSAVSELVAGDYRGHVHTVAGTEDRDRDVLRSIVRSHADVFEDVEYDVRDVLREDGRAAARVTMRATHRETGRSGEIDGLLILRTKGGRIAEEWASWDYLGLAEQLGLQGR